MAIGNTKEMKALTCERGKKASDEQAVMSKQSANSDVLLLYEIPGNSASEEHDVKCCFSKTCMTFNRAWNGERCLLCFMYRSKIAPHLFLDLSVCNFIRAKLDAALTLPSSARAELAAGNQHTALAKCCKVGNGQWAISGAGRTAPVGTGPPKWWG